MENVAGMDSYGFFRKVYGLLASQLAFSASFVYVMSSPFPTPTVLSRASAISLLLCCCGLGSRLALCHPWNYCMFFCFTCVVAYNMSLWSTSDLWDPLTFVVTCLCFVSISCVSHLKPVDVSHLQFPLAASVMSLSLGRFVRWYVTFNVAGTSNVCRAFIGSATMLVLIYVDTVRVWSLYAYDNPLRGAVELYIDFLHLFLHMQNIRRSMFVEG